jgi:hypothetical protein
MKRETRSGRSASRLIGAVLTAALYLAVLVAATQVNGAAEQPSPSEPAAAVVVADPTPAESPALTMAIAALGIAGAAAWRLSRVARRPRPMAATISRRRIRTTG